MTPSTLHYQRSSIICISQHLSSTNSKRALLIAISTQIYRKNSIQESGLAKPHKSENGILELYFTKIEKGFHLFTRKSAQYSDTTLNFGTRGPGFNVASEISRITLFSWTQKKKLKKGSLWIRGVRNITSMMRTKHINNSD